MSCVKGVVVVIAGMIAAEAWSRRMLGNVAESEVETEKGANVVHHAESRPLLTSFVDGSVHRHHLLPGRPSVPYPWSFRRAHGYLHVPGRQPENRLHVGLLDELQLAPRLLLLQSSFSCLFSWRLVFGQRQRRQALVYGA